MLDFLQNLIKEAGVICLDSTKKMREVDFEKKNPKDIVTEVDLEVEKFIISSIKKKYPTHSVLGEESGFSEGDEYCWIIDPIDGTTSFLHRQPFYSVSIAVQKDGVLEYGAVYAPRLDELFLAEKGGGATLNGEKITVSQSGELINCVLATGFACMRADLEKNNMPIFAEIMPQIRGIRRFGSAAIDLCYVACGKLDGFWELNLNTYDVAAGKIILEEAGGMYSDFEGKQEKTPKQVLATNGVIHGKMLDILRAYS